MGAVTAGVGVPRTVSAGKYSWDEVNSPSSSVLYDATMTQEGPYAVGASGDVLARRIDGWKKVLDKGPTVKSNPLRSCDVTSDGRHVWFAGGSGVIGQYDVVEEKVTDYSAPKGKTSTWEAIAAVGQADNERVSLVNGSGEFLTGTKTSEGGMEWSNVIKPGGGSSAKGIDFLDKKIGYICDTTSKVYETTDGGNSWSTIGLSGSGSVALYGITAVSQDRIYVTGGDGSIFRYNGAVWTKTDAGGTILYDIEWNNGKGLAGGGSGNLFDYRKHQGWNSESTPTSATFRGVALDTTGKFPSVAVGSSGTILERGFYTATKPKDNELLIDGSRGSGERIEYLVEVDGAIEKSPRCEDDERVTVDIHEGSTARGYVKGFIDDFRFSGSINKVAVTSGNPNEIYAIVNGDLISIKDESGTSN
ncbi:WD40/YVTN/BNR-like repeat-containing protein [Haladaptatus halobius]|uniref:WD40/YVTN/BNR-like repeat-containing protein n=1 Tax=Haladaptatus halobius TaxID=2884875 RepID=UPI001D0B5EE5|nr:hypothetical protein [Haladaptatus halobius]